MQVVAKLQLKADQVLACASLPDDVDLGTEVSAHGAADGAGSALLVFAVDGPALDSHLGDLVDACTDDRLTWVAYPKAGQLGTDLNRDRVAERIMAKGLQPVRQIAIDDVWSAVRLKRS